MNERVLSVPRTLIEEQLKQGFFESEGPDLMGQLADLSVFLDRKAAEEDPTHKQIIPYIAISCGDRYLVYRRTPKQGENRLHNKYSMGFGGHINDCDDRKDARTNFILAAMVRELNEEVFLPGFRSVTVAGFLNDDSNAVGKVHLGVAFIVEASTERFTVNEPEMIEAQWYDSEGIEKLFPSLESWSQLLWTQHLRPRQTVA